MRKLRLSQFIGPDAHVHVARTVLPPGSRRFLHTHDFAEVFWMEAGRLRHHINGKVQVLEPGDLVLMRPPDAHDLRPAGTPPAVLVNVAFHRQTLAFLRRRYFDGEAWPWEGAALPAMARLDPVQTARLHEQVAILAAGPPSRLALERFLLTLLGELTGPHRPPADARLPDWLQAAIQQCQNDPEALSGGVSALARRARRSREHLSRVLRQTTGQTPTELLNQLRLDRAAGELRLSDKPILAIALDCGWENLGYFYRLFKARFGVTPRRYRLQAQAVVRGQEG